MDRQAPDPPQRRDVMFCHQCENEWYRDEHGLECPECHSEFCEVIEADNDPRDEEGHIPADDEEPWDAPDPDEDDIDHFHWEENGPGQPPGGRLRATLNRTINVNPQTGQEAQGIGIGGLIGNALQGLLGGLLQQPAQNAPEQESAQDERRTRSAPGSFAEDPEEQGHDQGNGGSFTRHVHGPGYSFTMTTSSNNNLYPRNANAPQPFQAQPDTMDDMMRQMLMNIGVFPPGAQPPNASQGGLRMGPGGLAFTPERNDGPAPSGIGGGPLPFPAALFQLLGLPMGGVHGDAVYSQEGLDRIVSQLMEQHQAGNAPGPASEDAIKSLPQRSIEAKDLGESGTAECSICMDSLQPGDIVTVLPCEHWFHGECIKAWLGEHDTCPHCRKGIMPREDRNSSRPRDPSQAPLNDMRSPENTRTQVPGAFPLPRTDSSGAVPGSPTLNRQGGQSSSGVFDRMREAFGGGSPPEHGGDNERPS